MIEKSCLDCKFCKSQEGYEKYAKCTHEKQKRKNLVTGELEDVFCEVIRMVNEFCGKEGKWFELK